MGRGWKWGAGCFAVVEGDLAVWWRLVPFCMAFFGIQDGEDWFIRS